MYTPASFAVDDLPTLHDFIEEHSFATLVSTRNGEVSASHLPILLDRNTGARGRLIGHMARANAQWAAAADQPVLAIFHGPHAYISAGWYAEQNVVPTWNYTAAHVHGTLRLEQNRDRLLEIVRDYVDFYEADSPTPWSLETAEADFVDSLLDAIVGFTIEIDRIEGKWKLSQNHTPERRKKVVGRLQHTNTENSQSIAELMLQTLRDDDGR